MKLATEFFTGGKDTRSSENPPVLTFSLNNDVENRAVTVITTDESKRVKLSTVGWLFDMSLVGPYCHTISLLTATVVELHPEDGGCHSQCPRRCKLSNPRSQVLHNYAALSSIGTLRGGCGHDAPAFGFRYAVFLLVAYLSPEMRGLLCAR